MNEQELIREIYEKYWSCMITKDEDGLRSIMAEDYLLQHMTGTRQSREEFIKGLYAGTFNYFSAQHDDIDIEIKGNRAEMVGRSQVLAAVYGGGKNHWNLQSDFTLRKENEIWMLSSCSVSTYREKENKIGR